MSDELRTTPARDRWAAGPVSNLAPIKTDIL